jgi:DtxR family Mn-dependent transcriptional regulator
MPHFAHHFEENYLKAVFKLSQKEIKKVNNVALANNLDLNPATVLEMVRKLTEKKLLQLLPDKSIQLTEKGKIRALQIIRKHRLWEVFLVNKLNFKWSEVHQIAEQLEHIDSEDLIDRLDQFLDFPSYDPHGDSIPDKNGKIKTNPSISLLAGVTGKKYIVRHFAETADAFLDHLSHLQIVPGTRLKIIEVSTYDQSLTIVVNKKSLHLSEKVASNILVQATQ